MHFIRTFHFLTTESSPSHVARQLLKPLFITLPVIFLVACGQLPSPAQLADRYQLQSGWVAGAGFDLLTLATPDWSSGPRLHVYLEGDGRPWLRDRPAPDPTGRHLLALELLQRDPAPALYLGRPCYHLDAMPANCTSNLWTSGRYSETVVASMAGALTAQLRAHPSIREVVLIGYSGGGDIAVLLAPRLTGSARVSVITVAANLDTTAWSTHHRVLPLEGSLNPAEQAASGLPELHFQGLRDTVVPVATNAAYFQRHPQATSVIVEAFDHRCCWAEQWPQLLRRALSGAS